MSEFQRIVEWTPAYNKIAEGYGRHGMEVKFVLVGELAAVQFALSTNWMASVDRNEDFHSSYRDGRIMCMNKPLPTDIGYHAREAQYEGQGIQREACEYLGGAPCYYDGSGLRAVHFFDVFTDGGEDALWKALEEEYEARFVVSVPRTIETANFGELIRAVFGGSGEAES